MRARAQGRTQLDAQEVLPLERDAQTPPTEGGIRLIGSLEVRQALVVADVQRAQRDGLPIHPFEHATVEAVLLVLGGELRPLHVQELRPQESDAVAVRDREGVEVLQGLDVHVHAEAVAIRRLAGQRGVDGEPALARLAASQALEEAIHVVVRRLELHRAAIAVDADAHPLLQAREQVREADDAGDAEGAREHRSVRESAASRNVTT